MSSSDVPTSRPAADALARLREGLRQAAPARGLPPVERWQPPYGGDIDMRIAYDGTWFYDGTPIGRPALVRLFSTILRRDPDRFVLVTPVERVGITVEDAPFLAVEMAVDGEGRGRRLAFRTNVDDLVAVGAEHPLRFETDGQGGVRPYLLVRGGLWARLTRALAYDVIDLAEESRLEGRDMVGVFVENVLYPIAPAGEQERGA